MPDVFSALLLAALAASGPAAPPDTLAVYDARVVGAVFGEPFSIEVELLFHRRDRFRLEAEVVADGERETEVVKGTFRRHDRRVTLRSRDGGEQTFFLRGDRLVLDTEWPVTLARVFLGLPEIDLRARGGWRL